MTLRVQTHDRHLRDTHICWSGLVQEGRYRSLFGRRTRDEEQSVWFDERLPSCVKAAISDEAVQETSETYNCLRNKGGFYNPSLSTVTIATNMLGPGTMTFRVRPR